LAGVGIVGKLFLDIYMTNNNSPARKVGYFILIHSLGIEKIMGVERDHNKASSSGAITFLSLYEVGPINKIKAQWRVCLFPSLHP
jgi:hypothetical protein